MAGRLAARSGALRAAHRHVHARRTWRAAEAQLPRLRDVGVTVDPDDAGGGVRRRASAGATTACSGSRRSTATATPADLQHFVDTAHGLGLGGDPRRRLQPPRPVGQLPAEVLAMATPAGSTRTSGARRSTSTTRARGPARAGAVQRRLLGARVPLRRLPHRRRAADLRRLARSRPRGADAGRARDGGAAIGDRRRRARAAAREADAAGGGRRLRHGRHLQRGLPPFDARGADRLARSLHVGLPRHHPRVAVRGAARLPVPGPVLPVAVGAAAAHRRSIARATVHRLPREPRSGRQRRGRPSPRRRHQHAVVAGDVGDAAARAVDAAALPGPGVGLAKAVQLLLRSFARSAGRGVPGPPGVPQSVHAPGRGR